MHTARAPRLRSQSRQTYPNIASGGISAYSSGPRRAAGPGASLTRISPTEPPAKRVPDLKMTPYVPTAAFRLFRVPGRRGPSRSATRGRQRRGDPYPGANRPPAALAAPCCAVSRVPAPICRPFVGFQQAKSGPRCASAARGRSRGPEANIAAHSAASHVRPAVGAPPSPSGRPQGLRGSFSRRHRARFGPIWWDDVCACVLGYLEPRELSERW